MEEENENAGSSSHHSQPQYSRDDLDLEGERDESREKVGTLSERSSRSSKIQNLEQLANAAFKTVKRKKAKRTPRKASDTKASTSRNEGETVNLARTSSRKMARTSSRKMVNPTRKTSRRAGRVAKRRTRTRVRRRPKRRVVRCLSAETTTSGVSSVSDGACLTCRHRCCHLSYRECMGKSIKLSASPLLIRTYVPVANTRTSVQCEVSPEMIHAALRTLTMWRQEVSTDMILNYIMANYPVCPDREALLRDLEEKLRVAMITGMIAGSDRKTWSQAPALRRRLSTTHVTRYWQVYCDQAMAPVRRRVPNKPAENNQRSKHKK